LYRNRAASFSGTQCVTFSGPLNSPSPASKAPDYPAKGSCTATTQSELSFSATGAVSPSIKLYNAAAATVTVTANPSGKTGTRGSINVGPDQLQNLAFSTQ